MASRDDGPRLQGPDVTQPIFIGRAVELDAARAAIETVAHGNGALLLVCGEPGIGKTRLAEWIADRAAARAGARVLWGQSWETAGAPAFWPWVRIFRGYAQAVDDAELHE